MNGILNYHTTLGAYLMIRRVDLRPKHSATIKCIYCDNGNEKHTVVLSGEEYARWGDNDDYLGVICLTKINPADKIIGVDFVQSATTATTATTYEDTRSVHNDADIQRIQSLQQQLDEQATKLKTITELLFKNGSI